MQSGIKSLVEDKANLFSLLLCLVILLSTTLVSFRVPENARIINALEMVFIMIVLLTFKERPSFTSIAANKPLIFSAFVLWSVSVIVSFYISPLNVSERDIGWDRLIQTFSHVLFFVVVWHYINTIGLRFAWVVYAIALSSVIVMITHAVVINNTPFWRLQNYFNGPPLNAHIRHTGYQVTAALCLLLPMIYLVKETKTKVATYLLLLAVFSFTFWLGGRGSIAAVFIGVLFILFQLKLHNQRMLKLIVAVIICSIAGVVISELLAVFPWNGLLQSILRTADAENFNDLSTNRLKLWQSTIDSLQGHFLFGLGPQGYALMPNHIFGSHPHSVVLQFLEEWGIVGSVLFAGLLVTGFFQGYKNLLNRSLDDHGLEKLAAGTMIFSLSAYALVDGLYYHPQPSLYLAIAFAVWISKEQHVNESAMPKTELPHG